MKLSVTRSGLKVETKQLGFVFCDFYSKLFKLILKEFKFPNEITSEDISQKINRLNGQFKKQQMTV
jgi:hypothetical protein